jgi:hypothetical protein
VQDVFGPVLKQCGNAMAGAMSGDAIGRGQSVDFHCRSTIGDFEPVREVIAVGTGWNRQEWAIGVGGNGGGEDGTDGGAVHDIAHRGLSRPRAREGRRVRKPEKSTGSISAGETNDAV